MRTELTKQIQLGSLRSVWPKNTPLATVVESKLEYGDFAFQIGAAPDNNAVEGNPAGGIEDDDSSTRRLSVVVERKTVRDLVTRSKGGDHWKQLQRMRDSCEHSIMLIENDTRLAQCHDAFGPPLEPRPDHHVIENEKDIYRFMGRAILSSRAIKFLQTRDKQGTYRSIGALALMGSSSTKTKCDAPVSPPTAAAEQQKLNNLLASGGIHWRVCKAISTEVGSIKKLEHLYNSCSTNACRLGRSSHLL